MAHSHGLYLPHPLLPNPRNRIEYRRANQVTLADDRSARAWPLSSLAHLSDSDAEEGISEVDRDARLAYASRLNDQLIKANTISRKTRTSTPILHAGDEDNMTSGDESDDEDLTDASSDSNWSYLVGKYKILNIFLDLIILLDQDIPNGTDKSIFIHYSHLTRHYVANSPEIWDQPHFTLVRVRFLTFSR